MMKMEGQGLSRHRRRIRFRIRIENPDTARGWKGFRSVHAALSACQSSPWQQLLQIKERQIFYAEAEINFCQSIAKKESDDVGNERDDSNVCQVDTVHSTTELKIKFSN